MKELLNLVHDIERVGEARATRLLRRFVRDRTFPLADEGVATFFFYDGEPTEQVVLIHWVFGLESRQEFLRIGTTDAFYLPVELPNDARVEYKIELHRAGHKIWIRDPLNPHRAYDPFGSNSVCPMPGYHDPFWVHREPNTRRGTLDELVIDSKVFGEPRTVKVYLPAFYKPKKSYRLLICHDGNDYLKYAHIQEVLDSLIHRHEVHPLIVAMTSGGARNEEYGANPKQAKFLVEEVLPALERSYAVSTDPRQRGLMGASFGAVSSLYTAWSYPGVFGNLFLQSGSFVFTDVGRHDRGALWDPVVAFVNAFRADPGRIDARVFMSCGTFEGLIYYNRSLVPLLRRAEIDVQFVEARDGHNWIAWRDRLRDGLAWLFPGHLWMYYE